MAAVFGGRVGVALAGARSVASGVGLGGATVGDRDGKLGGSGAGCHVRPPSVVSRVWALTIIQPTVPLALRIGTYVPRASDDVLQVAP
jgi:hypothetical protein